jgi:hypothetical protein
MFHTPGLVFDGSEGVRSRFHVLRAHTRFRRYRGRETHFRRYRGCRVLFSCFHVSCLTFSCFAFPNTFSVVPGVSVLVLIFCTPRLIFDEIQGVGSGFHVLRSGLVFGDTKAVRSRFPIFHSQTCFWLCRGRRLPFSCFALPNTFSSVQRASTLVFMFCAPGLIFGGNEGVGSLFHVLCSRSHFAAISRASGPVFMFCAPGLIFGGIGSGGSLFHILRSFIFGGTGCDMSRFHVLRSLTRF